MNSGGYSPQQSWLLWPFHLPVFACFLEKPSIYFKGSHQQWYGCWVIFVMSSNSSISNTIGSLCTMLNGEKRKTGDESALITAEMSSAYLCPNIREPTSKLMKSLEVS